MYDENGGSAGPLFGGKGTGYEGGVRVPAIFWGPGRVKPAVVDTLMLYNVQHDPSERFNVAKKHPDMVKALENSVRTHQATVVAVPSHLEKRIGQK